MTEEDRKRIFEEIIKDPVEMYKFIIRLNRNIKFPEYHIGDYTVSHNIESYFINGHCNIYSAILCGIFGEYATPYANFGHIITKIGDQYYDALGFIDLLEVEGKIQSGGKYHERSVDEIMDVKYMQLGEYDPNEDDPIMEQSIRYGKELLESIIQKRFAKEQEKEPKENRTHKL